MSVVFHWIFLRSLVDPLKRLEDAATRISNGDFSDVPLLDLPDELGKLSFAFKKMNDFFIQKQQEMSCYSKELEEKVLTRTREIEEIHNQLIQAGKLAAVGELTAGIAHELNNPIGGILGYSQFMLGKMKGKVDEKNEDAALYCKYMEFMVRDIQRCKVIIEKLLRFSRSSPIEFLKIDVNVVLADTLEIIRNQMNLDKIRFEMHYANPLPLILGDPIQLQQVFMNILINAIKAVPAERQGYITVLTRISTSEDSPGVEVVIEDNGCGIPETHLNKIFDPFFTTRSPGEGTGLGLSLSYGIIKSHNGDIFVETKEGKGTTFKILLPSV
ncbi:MAG: HAMP domain-containing protein [Candidatus Aureabacteria bacterium]|nr:HAMP domain-containing protein [Candidatus Auribacterota bacterium]